jgi:uncharacterized oxidoreductase
MSPQEVATATLRALARREPVALLGQLKMLPTLLRIAPNTTKCMVAEL